MRWVILGLALLGAVLAGGIGAKWLGDAENDAEAIRKIEEYSKANAGKNAVLDQSIAKLNNILRAAYLLVAGCLVAIGIAVALQLKRVQPVVAGSVWIACAIVPAIFEPKSLVFSFFLIIAGGLLLMKRSTRLVLPLSKGALEGV
jgi:hypothetical protein